jgi:hypothetical protein
VPPETLTLYATFRGTLEDMAASDKRIIFALSIEFTDMRKPSVAGEVHADISRSEAGIHRQCRC